MIHESPKLALIDSSFLTRRRIVRDAQAGLFIVVIIVCAAVETKPVLLTAAAVFVLASVLIPFLLRRFMTSSMPEHVRSRLPFGPLDATEIPGAPHTYADLVRMWRDPSWRCEHSVDLTLPSQAPPSLALAPAGVLFALAAVTIASQFKVTASSARILVTGLGIICQLLVAHIWRRALRRRGLTTPSTADVWIVLLIASMAVLTGSLVASR